MSTATQGAIVDALTEHGLINYEATQGDTSWLPDIRQPNIESAVEAFRERNAKLGRFLRQYSHARSEDLRNTGDYGAVVRFGRGFGVVIPGVTAKDIYKGKRVYRLVYRHGTSGPIRRYL